MKLLYALLVVTVCAGCRPWGPQFEPVHPHWYVIPADDFKWKACVDGNCGGPVEYSVALWWVRTKGGTLDAHTSTRWEFNPEAKPGKEAQP